MHNHIQSCEGIGHIPCMQWHDNSAHGVNIQFYTTEALELSWLLIKRWKYTFCYKIEVRQTLPLITFKSCCRMVVLTSILLHVKLTLLQSLSGGSHTAHTWNLHIINIVILSKFSEGQYMQIWNLKLRYARPRPSPMKFKQ
jgi:hypothetical protein